MVANLDPAMNNSPSPEQGSDPALLEGPHFVHTLRRILEDREVPEEKIQALEQTPAVRTGQVTIADELARDNATGTTELPRVKAPKRPRKPRGTSYPQPDDSSLDENWTKPAPELPTLEAERGRETFAELKADRERKRALVEYQRNLANPNLKVGEAIARLRNRGFIPDPAKRGKALIKIGPAHDAVDVRELRRRRSYRR